MNMYTKIIGTRLRNINTGLCTLGLRMCMVTHKYHHRSKEHQSPWGTENWICETEFLRTVMEKTVQNLIGSNCNQIFEFYFTHGDYEL